MAGGRVGRDGIHGATFSSDTLTTGIPSSVVQIGNPIVQKKMMDVLLVGSGPGPLSGDHGLRGRRTFIRHW
jgi:phosphoribosylformylglycinamidine (FGAM) synthase-like enzyme